MSVTEYPNEVRVHLDRRRRPTPMLSAYWLRGRRRGGRRDGDRIYIDRYTAGEVGLLLALVLFSGFDMIATSVHVSAGGSEVNPVMNWFLQLGGTVGFAVAKLLATALGGLVLLLHVRFKGVLRALQMLVILYLFVSVWHVVVIWDRAVLG